MYIEMGSTISDGFEFMSSANPTSTPSATTGNLRGLLTEVFIWQRVLDLYELGIVFEGFNGIAPDKRCVPQLMKDSQFLMIHT